MYLDAYQRPLPGGAALGFGPVHQGILAYLDNGQQVILNTSLKHGRPVVSSLEEFNGGRPRLVRPLPKTWEDSIRIQQNAWNLVQPALPGQSSTTAKTLEHVVRREARLGDQEVGRSGCDLRCVAWPFVRGRFLCVAPPVTVRSLPELREQSGTGETLGPSVRALLSVRCFYHVWADLANSRASAASHVPPQHRF